MNTLPLPSPSRVMSLLLIAGILHGVLSPALAAETTAHFVPPLDTPRDRLFNDGWLFHRGDAPGAEAATYADEDWRRLTLPHDWSVEPIPEEGAKARLRLTPVSGTWRYVISKQGDEDAYAGVGYDDAAWKTITLPALPEDLRPHTYGWFRRTFDMPVTAQGQDAVVALGCIDDCDELWINGQKVSDTGVMPKNQPQGNCISASNREREYVVPGRLLKPGKNLIALCVYNDRDQGGFITSTVKPDSHAKAGKDLGETVGPFSSQARGGTHSGFTVGGTGWYRKHFTVDQADAGRCFTLMFGGISKDSDVWINGEHLGSNPYGYTSFFYDLTPHIRFGSDNVISVRAVNEGVTSRWYPGSGIYRNVWLVKTAATHIRPWGVRIVTPTIDTAQATVVVESEIVGPTQGKTLAITIVDADGATVAEGDGAVKVPAAALSLTVARPQLWDLDHPYLYTARIRVMADGAVIDACTQTFGIRAIAFSTDKGFTLNGKSLNMWGGCVHHDNGLLGAAAFARAEWRKLEILKANGYNAVRTAHNPMSDDFYDACDRLGLLVLDEVFDVWNVHKTPQDYGGAEWEAGRNRDLELWLRRTRNHPSIVIRSLGNEIGNREKDEDEICSILRLLLAEAKRWDDTRPYTGGSAKATDKLRFMGLYDVKGYNYRLNVVEKNEKNFPDWVAIGTENNPVGEGDEGQLATWNFMNDRSWFTGSFVWSAFDYMGESWSGWVGMKGEDAGWPYFAAACGLIDLTGFPKGGQFYRRVINGTSPIEINVLEPLPEGKTYTYARKAWSWPTEFPYWGWTGYEGKKVEVRVVTRAPELRLTLNGTIVGTGKTTKDWIDVVFSIPYQPGELVAEGLQDGQVVCRRALVSPGKPVALRLTSDRPTLTTNGNDLAFVTVAVVDAQGRQVMDGHHTLHFQVTGDGTLAACGNGDHKDVHSFRNAEACRTWRGQSLVILRPSGKSGQITLTASGDDLPSTQLTLPVQAIAQPSL